MSLLAPRTVRTMLNWATGATEQTLHQKAAEFLTLHKSVFS